MLTYAKVAQLVEHVPEEDVVAGSSPALGTDLKTPNRVFLNLCL